jgi:hypothetical protein
VNLQEQGLLLRQAEFVMCHGRKKSYRHLFLFEELIIFSKTRHTSSGHDIYIYKHSIKTSDVGLTESVSDTGDTFELWFRKRTPASTYVLHAESLHVYADWVRDISRLLWKQTLRNRERRLTELACLGVGDKLSLDLRPSKDNINDRFVDISLANRGVRLRTSLRSSMSSDHLRNGNKRPHSLVSISSSSSSSSGGPSLTAGLFHGFASGGLSLASYGGCGLTTTYAADSGSGGFSGGLQLGPLSTMHESPLELAADSHSTLLVKGNDDVFTLAAGATSSSQVAVVSDSSSSATEPMETVLDGSRASVEMVPDSGNIITNMNDSCDGNVGEACVCQGVPCTGSSQLSTACSNSQQSIVAIGRQDAYCQTTLKRPTKTVSSQELQQDHEWYQEQERADEENDEDLYY